MLFSKLIESNEREQAMKVLKNNFKHMSFPHLTEYLSDNEAFDEDLHAFYTRAFVEQERKDKELRVLLGITT